MAFRDRFFTPKVARAIMSPLGIVLFGAGTAAAVLLGGGLLAPLAGVALWGGNVARSIPREATRFEADTRMLQDPWLTYVAESKRARARFDQVTKSLSAGPLQTKLAELAARINDAVEETNRIATRGNALSAALATLDVDRPRTELEQLKATHAGRGMSPATVETVKSLEAQIAAGDRIASAAQQADERLRMLDARYDELVARAVEVSLGTGDSEGLTHDVDDLVTELEALRQALDETAPRSLPGLA